MHWMKWPIMRSALRWMGQVADPFYALVGLRAFPRFVADWKAYARMPQAETLRARDSFPCLHDRTAAHELDAHYFYVNGWAMRRVVQTAPDAHTDIASEAIFANLLGAIVPTRFVDYRPLNATLPGLTCIGGDILALPFETNSCSSVSCLHVAEHIGLGRYGDPLDPEGTKKAACELARVLAPGGNLFFALPIGRPRLCFNGHRVHATQTILDYFPDLELREFTGVHDDGRFVEHVPIDTFSKSEYACGMFWFRKS